MRTSRISRDTQKIVTSLSTSRTRPARQGKTRNGALQNSALNGNDASAVAKHESEASEQSDSEQSSAPGSLHSDFENEVSGSTTRARKRKRGQDTQALATIITRRTEQIAATTTPTPRVAKQNKNPKKARRTPAKKVVGPNGTIKIEPPSNWEEVYALTRQMRNENVAPVDTMGCESLADRNATPRDQRFQTLVALMLSSQTKDTVTSVAIWNMQKNLPGGFNLESILAIEPTMLNSFINKVGFHNLKTKYIKATAEILRDKWSSDIPDTIAGLTSLPGVGPKMAYLCMSAAWGRDQGIGVDVHVHRITNLWGWHKTKNPEETRGALESWLPREKWHDINNLLVGFGQTICLPVGRRCGNCYLAEKRLCPSSVVAKTTKVKKEEIVVKEEDMEGGGSIREQVTTLEEQPIKAEELAQDSIPDIEDIGKASRRIRNR